MDAATQTDLIDALFAIQSPSPNIPEFRSGLGKLKAIERCRAEQDEILNRADVVAALCVCAESPCQCPGVKAWLVVLGLEDWECEKRFVEAGA
jgi:hypothetical protein